MEQNEEEKIAPKLPEWLREQSDGTFIVNTKQGDFTLKELEYERILASKKRALRGGQVTDPDAMDRFELTLISDSIVTPVTGELELKKMKGSTVMRLRAAVQKLYDIESFL